MINTPQWPEDLLYERDWYEFLRKYHNILWNIWPENLLWEWFNGVILHNLEIIKPNEVLKLPKSEYSDEAIQEFHNQKKFSELIKEMQLHPENYSFNIKDFAIPYVRNIGWIDEAVIMEKIEWLSYRHLSVYYYYIDHFKDYSFDQILSMWDAQFVELTKKMWLKQIPKTKSEEDKRFERQSEIDFIMDTEGWYTKEKTKWIYWLLHEMKKLWYDHGDDHFWNVMLWRNAKTYIIDFWRSIITPK